MNTENTALWLYGSFARGDTDPLSDFDLLLIGSDLQISEEVLHLLQRHSHAKASPSRYAWKEITGMHSYGSLFLHHIKAEGKKLFEGFSVAGKLQQYLDSLRPYARSRQDLGAFKTGLKEVRQSLENGGSIPFELSVLGTLIRHASILACYLIGRPAFGRLFPVVQITEEWCLDPMTSAEFASLYQYKLFAEGRVDNVSTADEDCALKWCSRLESLLRRLEDEIG